MPKKSAIDRLAKLIDEAGLKVTFSLHCRSGIVGKLCRCWRCRGEQRATADESAAERDCQLIDLAKVFYRPFFRGDK